MKQSKRWIACLVVMSAVFFLALPTLGYNIKECEGGYPIRWGVDGISLRVDEGMHHFLKERDANDTIVMGVQAWAGFPGVPEMVLVAGEPREAGFHDDGPSNGIYLVEDWPYESNKLAVTVTTFSKLTGKLLDADILVNSTGGYSSLDDDTMPQEDADYDIVAVMTHELGHVLGLGDSVDDEMATMWGYIMPGEIHQRTLNVDDEDGITTLYNGAVPPDDPTAGCGTASVSGMKTRMPALAWCMLLIVPLVLIVRAYLLKTNVQPLRKQSLLMGALALFVFTGPLESNVAQKTQSTKETRSYNLSSSNKARLKAFIGVRSRAFKGVTRRLESKMSEGFISTEFEVTGPDNEPIRFSVLGGSVGDIVQQFGHEDIPEDETEVLVVPREDGRMAWARVSGDDLYGGWLAGGPPIRGVVSTLTAQSH